MNEREEIQLRRCKSIWQSRQDAAGMITLFLGFVSGVVVLFFLSAPGWQLACVMVWLIVLLCVSCWRLILSAARVVEIHKLLNPSKIRSQFKPAVIETEIVEPGQQRFVSM